MLIEEILIFFSQLDAMKILVYFWPFFLLDMTRYLLLDFIVIITYIPKRYFQRFKYQNAQKRLYKERPLISILVPGKNEGKHIAALARSLSQQSYKNFELIIVDDGSDDQTPIICKALEKEGLIDIFIRNNVRGGKASAANTAFNFSKGKYIVHIDADSHMAADSIETILLPFYMDENIGAVGGDVRVANSEESFATRLQAIEYMKSLSTGRTVAAELGILRIIAGAHGAFRRDILLRLHGWDVGPGLDGDITLKIRKLGFRVVHEPMAVCYTHVPDSFKKLAKQRFRWDRSIVRFRLRKHKDILLPSKSFSLSNFITSAENIFFNILLDIKWWLYITQLIIFSPEVMLIIFIINYVLYLIANIIQFLIASALLHRSFLRKDYVLFLFIPLIPFYTGLYLRLVRTYAYLMEIFHGASYRDKWNPWKVSKIAEKERL